MSDFTLYRNGVAVPAVEWDATWTEVVGAVGTASVSVQNRENDPALDWLARDVIRFAKGTWTLWEGEVVQAELDLPAGYPFRRWNLTCSDWNTIPDERLVEVPDGQHWQTESGGDTTLQSGEPNSPYVYDHQSTMFSDDQTTIRQWYANKVLSPGGFGFDTLTYVNAYVPNSVLYDGVTGKAVWHPSRGTLKAAIAGLSALASVPVYDWIDPDRKVHHQAFVGTNADALPDAPALITDDRSSWDGTTTIGGRALKITADMTYAPEVAFVNGNTDYVRLGDGDPDIGTYGQYLYNGTGWGHSDLTHPGYANDQRQILVDGQATTREQRDALADAYTQFGAAPRYTGTITIGGRESEADGGTLIPLAEGWRCAQAVTIHDERLAGTDLQDGRWPITRITGSLVAGDKSSMLLRLDFGEMPIGRFSEKFANQTGQNANAVGTTTKKKPAVKHTIYYQVLNPVAGESQILTSQARDDADNPVKVAGIPVHWEIVAVYDADLADQSGFGESVSPADTNTDPQGVSTTTFTAGTKTGVWYHITATTPFQDL